MVENTQTLRCFIISTVIIFSVLFLGGCGKASPKELTLYTTTSLYDSGLLDFLLPVFEKENNIKVKVIAAGSGEALKNAEEGNADIVIAHDPDKEIELERRGILKNRTPIARNYFQIVGPIDDPASVKGSMAAEEAFFKIFNTRATFVSRGDNSGTHSKELKIWASAGIDPKDNPNYVISGQGMSETLRIASEKQAYTLTDTGTFYSTKNLELTPLLEKDESLVNIYSVSLVNPVISPRIRHKEAKNLLNFLTSKRALDLISNYSKNKTPKGIKLFEPIN